MKHVRWFGSRKRRLAFALLLGVVVVGLTAGAGARRPTAALGPDEAVTGRVSPRTWRLAITLSFLIGALLASAPAKPVVNLGNAVVLLGIIVALAARLPAYVRRSEVMAAWGTMVSCFGAAAVLLGTASEISQQHGAWYDVDRAVLVLTGPVIVGIVIGPDLIGRLRLARRLAKRAS